VIEKYPTEMIIIQLLIYVIIYYKIGYNANKRRAISFVENTKELFESNFAHIGVGEKNQESYLNGFFDNF
jgi:hypothetical protein